MRYIPKVMTDTKAKKVSVQTVGCRLNQYESEQIAAQLYPYGFERVSEGEEADLYIINTCTVTHRADSDCRSLIRKAARLNPNGRIVVTGCYVEHDPQNIAGMEGVDIIVGNADKERLAVILAEKFPSLFDTVLDQSCSATIADFHEHNRAWVKISDGCNQRCSYCIIPSVRGRLKNRPARQIIDDINSLVAHGYKEVVLTGVNVGHYKNQSSELPVKNLAGLCRLILRETDLYRLRISSIEPQTVRDDLLAVLRESAGRICRHMHIPLQSGSSRILSLMRRPYDASTYIERIRAVKATDENTVVGADVMVGFPGETDEDFRQSYELAQSGLIDYLHVFSYSPRGETPASRMTNPIKPAEIKRRSGVLNELSGNLRLKAHQRQVGRVLEVISEHTQSRDGFWWGVADNYLRVKFALAVNPGKNIIRVRITAAASDGVSGDIL